MNGRTDIQSSKAGRFVVPSDQFQKKKSVKTVLDFHNVSLLIMPLETTYIIRKTSRKTSSWFEQKMAVTSPPLLSELTKEQEGVTSLSHTDSGVE